MQDNLSCNVIKDLLPLYIDGIANEETIVCVKEHIAVCKDCCNEYKRLQENEKKSISSENDVVVINLLKRRMRMFLSIVITLGIIFTSIKMYCYYHQYLNNYSKLIDFIGMFALAVVQYFAPLFTLFIAIIWRRTVDKNKSFFPNVVIVFFGIMNFVQIIFLIINFYYVV